MSAVQTLSPSDIPKRKLDSAETRPMFLTILTVVTALTVALSVGLSFWPGTDTAQGDVQRIFYLHVPAFSGAFIAFIISVIGAVVYLRTRSPRWDMLAVSSIEVGLILAIINCATGMIWERPIWNTWWTWDPRLTWEAIMILTYAAYFMLRSAVENPEQRRLFASVYGILAMLTVIMTLIITRVRKDTIHPVVVGPNPQDAQGGFDLAPRIGMVVGINSAIWSIFLPWTLIWYRLRMEKLAEKVRQLKAQVLEN